MTNPLINTSETKLILIPRILAGAPLVMFGAMHLSGAMPMKPLVDAAGLPMPELLAVLAPIAQVLAGLLLLMGALTRIGGLLAIGTMIGALITHIKIPNDQWPTPSELDPTLIGIGPEPTFMMALAAMIIIASALIIFKGAGAWSVDGKLAKNNAPDTND